MSTWIEANVHYHDGFINTRPPQPPHDMALDKDLLGKHTALHTERCASCHEPGDVARSCY